TISTKRETIETQQQQSGSSISINDISEHCNEQDDYNSSDGNFKIQFIEMSAIGSGGFGTVFKVKHRLDDKIYAVKRVQFGEKKQKVLKEVKSLAKLDSDFVVKYYNSWLESNHLFIQMEFCSQNLKSLLEVKAIVFERQPEEEMKAFEYFICCEILKELLECVEYLHSWDPPVIHRDLKPDNILIEHNVRYNRFVKVCDFGLATDHVMPSMSHTEDVVFIIFLQYFLWILGLERLKNCAKTRPSLHVNRHNNN
ncbi:unnamed protein product, partial [Medioppia subpectinata]